MSAAPYRVLFSNDTTNIEQCTSPYSPGVWRHRGPVKPFDRRTLEGSVDETAGTGIDAHMLQPGVGWVPWWKSRHYPFQEHVRFMKERYGKEPAMSGFAQFMADGGDIVQVFIDRCRATGLAPIISFRLNDSAWTRDRAQQAGHTSKAGPGTWSRRGTSSIPNGASARISAIGTIAC